jgi:outer membrane protein assembly factor BamB
MPRSRAVSAFLLILFWLTMAGSSHATDPVNPNDGTDGADDQLGASFRGDAARTGTMPGPSVTNQPGFLWRHIVGNDRTSASPAVGEGMVVYSDADSLTALDAESGSVRWSIASAGTYSSPLISGGMVYIGTAGDGLRAFDLVTGDAVWTFRTGAIASNPDVPAEVIESSPAIADGTLFVGGGFYGGLFALDPETGAEKWRFDTHGEVWSSPAVADGVVYVTTQGLRDAYPDDPTPSALYAIDATMGRLNWWFPLGPMDSSYSTPAVVRGMVVFGATHEDTQTGTWFALDAAAGTEHWRIETEHAIWGRSAGSNDEFVFLPEETDSGGNRIRAIYPYSTGVGGTIWTSNVEADRINGTVSIERTLYFKDNAHHLVALDGATGAELWRLELGPGGAPVLADGRIYVSGGPLLYALGPDGKDLPSPPAQPLTGPGSTAIEVFDVRSRHYGLEPGGYWIWEPAEPSSQPLPVIMYLSGCCNNEVWPAPEEVYSWLSHLARQGYIVIAPVYHVDSPLEDSKARLRDALDELAQPGHSQPDMSRFAIAAYSYGGVPAVRYAAAAGEGGLPVPRAIFAVAPCSVEGFSLCPDTNTAGMVLPAGMKAVVLGFADDELLGLDGPRAYYDMFSSLPPEDRDFAAMYSDTYGQPVIYVDHATPWMNQDAADWYGVWKLSDALFACAFAGDWCEYALGDTPEQRFMGEWSDGMPVAGLVVEDRAFGSREPSPTATP